MTKPIAPTKTLDKNKPTESLTPTLTLFSETDATLAELIDIWEFLSPGDGAAVLAFARTRFEIRGGK